MSVRKFRVGNATQTLERRDAMLKDFWNDIFSRHSSFGYKCLAGFILLGTLVLFGLIGVLLFIAVDTVGITPTKTMTTMVEAKQVSSAYTSFIHMGKSIIPQYHSASYRLLFKIDEEEVDHTVEKEFFDTINVGDTIDVDYGQKRLSGSHMPTSIRFVGR